MESDTFPDTIPENPWSTLNSGSVSKYATAVPDAKTNTPSEQEALFFNYHEFVEDFYIDIGTDGELKEHDEDHNLCVTHFPNVYVAKGSLLFEATRIVRIPRRFESTLNAPCFSTCLPGLEPAALLNGAEGARFVPHGFYDGGQLFGYSSTSPLSKYLSQAEFEEIVTPINEILSRAYSTYTGYNILDLLLDIITLGCWHYISKFFLASPLLELEDYVTQVNNSPLLKDHKICIISPRRSAYLSLDFQVPRPSLPE